MKIEKTHLLLQVSLIVQLFKFLVTPRKEVITIKKIIAVTIISAFLINCSLIISQNNENINKKAENVEYVELTDGRIIEIQN